MRTRDTSLILVIAYLGFISLGLPDAVLGVAWPSVRETFGLRQNSVGLVFIASGCGYFLSSFCTGRLLKLTGIGTLLAASSALVALSAWGYATAPLWLMFAACAIAHGIGSGAIDGGLNHYAAHHFSARHMNWLHACYSLGATLGPLVMTTVLVRGGSWRAGYFAIGSVLLLLCVVFLFTRHRWDTAPACAAEPIAPRSRVGATLQHARVWLHIAIFFLYTGLEVTVGQWSFTLLTEARHLEEETAGLWVTVYWGSIAAGRVLFGFVVERFGIDRLLRGSLLAAALGALLLSARLPGALTFCGLALIGLALAPIYPCLMTRTPQRLGAALAAHAIGFQVSAAMLGAAALPSLAGLLAGAFGLETIALLALATALVLCALHETLLRSDKTQ